MVFPACFPNDTGDEPDKLYGGTAMTMIESALPPPPLGSEGNAISRPVEINHTVSEPVHRKIVYFVHDLSDPAVHRRVRMLRMEGCEIVLLGFRRSPHAVQSVEQIKPVDFGRTWNSRLAKRAGSVLKILATPGRIRHAMQGATIVIARQLEMLAIATRARQKFAPTARLVFECLDIHRLMIAPGLVGMSMRRIERALLRRCDLLIVSSPAFLSAYFERVHLNLPRTLLVENKVLASEIEGCGSEENELERRPLGPPWRIGWYGTLRCRRSLQLLAGLVDHLPGQVEVVIQGNPDPVVMSDLRELVAASPGLELRGPYDRLTDLPKMYASVHFAWTMDFFEATGNSRWLLPNRLYEGGLHGALPIALRSTETGRWLDGFGAGVPLEEPIQETLVEFFKTLNSSRYQSAKASFSRIPRSAFVHDDRDCTKLCQLLMEL